MKNRSLLAAVLLFACASQAYADPIVQVWLCNLNEGKTRADVIELSTEWLKAAKSMGGGKGIDAHLEFPLVSDNSCDFKFVMTANTTNTWSLITEATNNRGNADYARTAMGKVDEAWYGLAVCSSSSLWNSVDIK